MKRGLFAVFVVASVACTTMGAGSALGAEVEFRVGGDVSVSTDFGACATATFDTPQLVFGGEFTAVGTVTDEARTVVVHEVHPIVGVPGDMEQMPVEVIGPICTNPAFDDPLAGEVTYTLNVHTLGGDYLNVVVCRDTFSTVFECTI